MDIFNHIFASLYMSLSKNCRASEDYYFSEQKNTHDVEKAISNHMHGITVNFLLQKSWSYSGIYMLFTSRLLLESREVRERFLSSLLSPTVLFFSPNPLLPLAPVADGGSLPVGRHPLCSRVQPLSLSNFDFSTSSLLTCSGSSSVSGRIRRTKPVSEGVLSFPGEMARSWMVGSE
ncbi:hypothetical protein YC2023_058402 [Brassica napus]